MTLQKQRVSILREIDKTNKQRCVECLDPFIPNGSRCGCPASTKVIKLGVKLLKHTSPRKVDELVVLDDKVGLHDFTLEEYQKLKRLKVTDKDIFKSRRVSSSTFLRWKRDNGIMERGKRV